MREIARSTLEWPYNLLGRYREAVAAFDASSDLNNEWLHAGLIMSCTELGQEEDARAEARRVLSPGTQAIFGRHSEYFTVGLERGAPPALP